MSRSRRSVLASVSAAALVGLAVVALPAAAEPSELADAGGVAVRNGAGMSVAAVRSDGAALDARARPTGGGTKTNGISAHGGPVMLGTTKVYYIWYGNWSTNTGARPILEDFAGTIGGSPYFNINTTYYAPSGTKVSNSVVFAGSTTDGSSATSLSDADIKAVVERAFTNGLPKVADAVYFVLTAKGVTATSGFLTRYCGWHTHASMGGVDVKYSFVGNPGGSSACLQQTSGSPNANPDADGMASIVAHELEEAVTDPDLNAWYDNRGYENADKCAWTFGTTYSAGTGLANVKLGSRDYLIQRNWVNASGGYCAMAY
jgi:hypothetical protein